MKRKISVLIVLTGILLQGCIVKSLHPFFTASDVVIKKELINTWTDQDGSQWSIRAYDDKPGAYEMHWKKEKYDVVMLAHVFKLNDQLYMDVSPITDNSGIDMPIFNLHLLPTHSVAKVIALNANEVKIKWFNETWLSSLLENNRIRIPHEVVMDEDPSDKDDKMYVLTASTDELQKFLIKYGDEDQAFDSAENTVWLTLKRGS